MKCNYNILFISMLCVLISCSCKNEIINRGIYGGKNNPHTFVFSEDSTFKYEYYGVWYKKSSGTWEKRDNVIYLSSYNQIDKIPVEYSIITTKEDKPIVININIQDNDQQDYICFPYINGEIVSFDPKRGSYSFESEVPIDELYFLIRKAPFVLQGTGIHGGYDDVETERTTPKLSFGDSLSVQVNIIDSLFGYKTFKNEELKIKNGNIIFNNGDKRRKLSLKK